MIDFKNVSKVYADTVALKNATLHIDQGDFVFIVGPTGSGKSTFIKLIIKEIEPDEGEIIVDGKNLSKMSNRDVAMLRRDIGMVFQDFKLLENKTVFENVSFAMEVVHSTNRAVNRQVPQMLSVMGIDDKAKNYLIEEGFDPKNGARPLRRKIEDEVESLLSEAIISEELVKGDIPTLKLIKGKLKLVKE